VRLINAQREPWLASGKQLKELFAEGGYAKEVGLRGHGSSNGFQQAQTLGRPGDSLT
jgi:hypothetical protein